MEQKQEAALLSQFYIKVGGSIPEGLMDDVAEVVVDTSLHLPSMFTIQLYDRNLKWVNDKKFSIGKEVEIEALSAEDVKKSGKKGVLIKGEITALETEFGEDGMVLFLIRGYTRDHRLHRGKKVRTFLKMKDSAIVKKVAGEAGLSVKTDSTTAKHEYVLQNNQTDFEFLLARAQRVGYWLYVEDKTLFFKKPDSLKKRGPTLRWGHNLRSFRVSVSSAYQNSKVLVKGWDVKTKKEIVGEAQVGKILTPQNGVSGTGASISKKAFGQAESIVVRRAVSTKQEADQMANALASEISGDFIRAEGRTLGEPTLQAGYKVKIESVGERSNGTYLVTSARHIYSSDIGYETTFTVNGATPETVSSLLSATKEQAFSDDQQKISGVVVGIVTNNNDPDDLARVKIKYPWLSKKEESNWARIASPMAGQDRGMLYIPEVNDEVLVSFEHGDINYPYVVGVLWNGQDKPPLKSDKSVSKGKVNKRLIKTRCGHQIMLNDEKGSEQIKIIDHTGNNEILIDSANKKMHFRVDGDFIVEAKGKIELTSKKDMVLDSSGKTEVTSKGSMNLEAKGSLTGKSTSSMTLESSTSTTVKGLNVSVEAKASAALEGKMTEVKGTAIAKLKGGVVMIN